MPTDTIILSGARGSAYGDTLQVAFGKTNDTTSVTVSHVANTNNPHNVTLAQLGAAPLNSPTFTGFPTAPQPALNDLSAALATTAFVHNQGYLTANQSITLTGDASGAGTTTITLTLAATGVAAGTYSTLSVDAKGRVLIGTNPVTTITASGDASASGSFLVGGALSLNLMLAATGTAGTYNQVTTDTKGRVTSGTAIAYLTANQVVTVTGDATGSGSTMIALALAQTGVAAGTYSTLAVDAKGRALLGSNPTTSLVAGGDASGSASFVVGGSAALSLTLAAAGTAGTYTRVVTDAKGRVTSGSNVAFLVANQQISVTGDASGAGSTAIALTLASVVAAGTYNSVVADAKGRITSGTLVAYATGNQSISITGDAAGSGTTAIVLTLAASGVTAGSFTRVVVDAKGRVTAGASLLSADVTTALGYTPISTAQVGVASGLATLDSGGHLTLAQVPASLVGGVNFQGLWNASLNQPPLSSGTGTKGYLYRVSVAGSTTLDSNSTWYVGDDAVFDGSAWSKLDGLSSEVLSVAGRTGAVVLAVGDISGAAPLASPVFTGTPAGPTPATSDSSTALATTAYVRAQGYVTGNQAISVSGDASGTGSTAIVLTLASAGAAGTYTQVTTDAKGRVVSGSAIAFLTGNQPVAISGDASGTGATAIVLTLAFSGVSPGTYSAITVDAKGRATAGANPQTTITASGDASASGSFLVGGSMTLALALAAVGTPGTFSQAIVDAKGRVTAGSNPATTIALSGDATASSSFLVGSAATLAVVLAPVGAAGTYNQVVTDAKGRVTAGASLAYLTSNQTITASGDASGAGTTALVLTLAAVGAAGTYNSVSTDAKGRVVAGTNLGYLLSNQPVAISGDASGTGTTAITLTLAASGVVAGTYSTLVVDAKGRATAGSNPTSTVSASGDATGLASFPVGGTAALALSLAAVGAAGTYSLVATDAKGRVTSGANPATALSVSGDATASVSFVVGGSGTLSLTLAGVGTAGTYTQVSSDAKGRVISGSNPATALALSGDASASGSFLVGGSGTLAVTLASVGLVGTYNQVTTDSKGRVVAGSTLAYLTGNQSISVSGDASGAGSTAIALTLAASGVVAGTYSILAVDSKGRATSGSNPSTTVTASGDASGSASFLLGAAGTLALTLAAVGAAGTYTQVVTDAKGRVTSGTAIAFLTANQPITISGDASGTGATGISLVLATVGVAGTYSQVATDAKGRVISGSSPATTITLGGDASGSGSSTVGGTATVALALAVSGVVAGSYANASISVDAKGRVTSASASPAVSLFATAPLAVSSSLGAYALSLSASGVVAGTYALATVVLDSYGRATSASAGSIAETITATGDATGSVSVTTASGSFALPLTLATVGTSGTYSQVTTDAKGRVIAGTNPISGVSISGDASGSAIFVAGGTATVALTLAATGVTAGTYVKVVIDSKGRVAASAALAAADVTTALGYTPANLVSPSFTGAPLAPAPSQFDASTRIATTGWTQALGFSFNAWFSYSASGTIPIAQVGGFILIPLANTAAIALTLPLAATVPQGAVIAISNAAPFTSTVSVQGSDSLGVTTTITMQQYDKVTLTGDGSGVWRVTSYTNYALGSQRILNNLNVGGASTLTGSLSVSSGMSVAGSTSLGVATASTAPLLDNTTRIATTSFVANSGLGFSPVAFSFPSSGTLSSTSSGAVVYATGSAAMTLTLPLSSTMLPGDVIAFQSTTTAGLVSIVVQGSDTLDEVVSLAPNDHIGLTTNGTGAWHTVWHNIFHNGNLAIPGTLSVAGSTLLSAASGVTVVSADSSTNLATTAFVKGQAYLTANQPIAVSGDATGSGATAVALTLAAVGTMGTYSQVTTDAKGRVIAGTNPISGVSISGDASGSAIFVAGGTALVALTLASTGVAAGTYSQVTVDAKGRVLSGNILPVRSYDLYAASFDSPNTADWKVNALASATSDPTNTALTVRSFSNTIEQGVGFNVAVPAIASQVTLRYRIRSATAPASASTTTFNLYSRLLPNGVAVPAWTAATTLTAVTIPTNAYYIAAVQTISLAALGWTAGNSYQVEFTRAASGVAYAVYLLQLTVELS